MALLLQSVNAEIRPGVGSNSFYEGDAVRVLERLAEDQAGSIQLIYMDPPFATGQRFTARMRIGAKEWKSGQGSLTLPTYDDTLPQGEYLAMMQSVLANSKRLLKPEGLIFIHLDWRMQAHIKLLADEIFGEKNFLNEIVWVYDTGGRSKRFFSRKHDIILLYAASESYDLHTEDVAAVREGERKSHMKRCVDEDGRVYRTIKSGGKVYRYYDDEPVPPSDVWTDVSQMQQKDPQRLGYDTQKPLALMERIIRCASRPGDTVLDPFCGSGTALEAAWRLGRSFIGIDQNPTCAEYVRRRTSGAQCAFYCAPCAGSPLLEIERAFGITDERVYLNRFELPDAPEGLALSGLDAVDSWALGAVRDGQFWTLAEEGRSFKKPELSAVLCAPLDAPGLALRVSDILGRRFFYSLQV